jgi:hypothetical protein
MDSVKILPPFSLVLLIPGANLPLVSIRVSSKQTKINFGSNRNKPKQDLFRVCFGLFRETKKKNFSVCFGVSNLYRNNRNKRNCFETNRNNPEFSKKYQNVFSKHNQPAKTLKKEKEAIRVINNAGYRDHTQPL